MDEFPYAIAVEGEWSPAQSKAMRNKLQLHFQSKKKSNGGDCRVEVSEDAAGKATVCFKSEEVRERVLAKQNHEVSLENQNVKLKLMSQSVPAETDDSSDLLKDSPDSDSGPRNGGSGAEKEDGESAQNAAVLLENVSDSISADFLSMLVDNVSGLNENGFSLEIILETNSAVLTFINPNDVERFLTASLSNMKFQKYGLTARPLEAPKSVRVESLPHSVVKDMLELFFEKNWALPVNIIMIPEEQAAIVTFDDPKVVGSISKKKDHVICKIPIQMYPYYKSLGTALYGKERPTWKMPEPFTESVHQVIWKFLLMKKQLKTINEQMSPYFCSVDMETPQVKLSPLPSLLRQKGLTAQHVDMWRGNAQEAFRQLLAQYTAFECSANAPAWSQAEKEIRSVVKEDAALVMDASRGTLTVAGRAHDMKRIRDPVESIVRRVMSQIERQRDGISEAMDVSPAMFYILEQEGLQKAALDISPELVLSYKKDTNKLIISGLTAEVFKAKSWILERKVKMCKKPLDVDTHVLNFLKSADSMEMSQHQKIPGETDDSSDGESAQNAAVLLENVSDSISADFLSMLVENVSGLNESGFSLEIILETNSAVLTINPNDVERFLTASLSNMKFQKYGLTARPLEAPKSVRVESLPHSVVKDMLELFFEKNWALPVNIIMIPEEQAAIVTFDDPKVVGSISKKKDHVICKIPIQMYPYYKSLGTALYGKERPTWKMPEPFTESVHQVIWKFLLMKKQLKTINEQMSPYFCSVDMETPQVKLSPLPSLLRQKGLTAQHVDMWRGNAQEAFRQLLAQYTAFECSANAPAWSQAEKEIRSVVKEDAALVMDASRGTLTVAGRAHDMKRIRDPVESIVRRVMSQIERQRDGISEAMDVSPAMFYILEQEGLQKAALDISPELVLSYKKDTNKLIISGLTAEVFKAKSWILARKVKMCKKPLDVDTHVLDFLKSADSMEMSQHLFTSQGIGAVYSIENRGVLLTGSTESVLADAEKKVKMALSLETLAVEDQKVLQMPKWTELYQELSEIYSSSKKRTVSIQIHPGQRNQITVAGFRYPVKEVSSNLRNFIVNYSEVQETVHVKSCAVVQFIQERKSQAWNSIAKAGEVTVRFDSRRPRINISGARLHVQKAKASFQELAAALFTENFTVDKPGAKKYFLSQGSILLFTVMKDFNCAVVLRPENEEEEEEENYEEERGLGASCYCKVSTTGGVLVSVSKADICAFGVDAVVNAANEDLKHISGVALALLTAAGPQLQKLSDDYIAKNGRLRPGDAIVTDSCNLPCKYVVHAVGPRFSEYDRKTAVLRLKMAVKQSLRQAAGANCSTVALPAISSGVFGFPLELCAQTIAEAVREYCDNPEGLGSLTEIHLVDNNSNTVSFLAKAINNEFSDLRPEMTIPQQADRGGSESSRGRGRGGRGGHQSWAPGGHGTSERGGGGRGESGGRGGGSQGRFRPQLVEKRGYEKADQERITMTTPEGLKIILRKGNIQDQFTDVIVNTISENLNLSQGAVSKAILDAAGQGLQTAVRREAGAASRQHGDVVVTDGFNLKSQKVFHAVCPFWDNGAGQAKEELISVIRYCLAEAEKLKMASVSFPAIGTGNLSFPREVVSGVLLSEIQAYSRRRTPQHLREVAVVVHPSDSQTVDCFTKEFQGQAHGHVQREPTDFQQPPRRQTPAQSQQSSASFGQVSSPSLGVYKMQMGHLTLEVSSGDITKETSDVIINSSNKDFNLKSGVSKAILDAAGLNVLLECSKIVSAPGYQQTLFIMTTAGLLPSRAIIHVVGHNDPVKIKEVVYTVLKFCEEQKFSSVSFPALGTGQGGASPSQVADAMIDAVVDFVRKKHPKSVRRVKILIFQTNMVNDFHKSMRRREGEGVEEKSIRTKVKDAFTSFFTGASEERAGDWLVLEQEEFEPAMFQLCAESSQEVNLAKKRIQQLILMEQAKKTIKDPYINELSQSDVEELKALQTKLTVSIRLERRQGDQEPYIQLEGLTRDVLSAESTIRDIIKKVARTENQKQKALLLSALVEWQYPDHSGTMVPFDIFTNCSLEEALEKQCTVKIKINNKDYIADVKHRKAATARGQTEVELFRKDLKDDTILPDQWEDMKGSHLKVLPLTSGSKEYTEVEKELTKTGLTPNIISIERVQNKTLWQSYQLLKKKMEDKNKHKNNERQLFHGTGSKSIDLINSQGFNRSYAGAHGAMHGNGSYFAVDPAYSAQGYAKPDNKGHKRMYLARVLVGDFIQGASGMITPPSRSSGNAADLYDSVADNTSNPTMFVIFNDIQAYPEYLITFT